MVAMSDSTFVFRLQDEIEYGEKGMFRKYLIKDGKWQVMLICLRSGIEIPEHTSSYDSFITVIQGRGVFLVAGRKAILEPGVFIELPANTLHALRVTENLAILKVVEHHESQPSADGKKKTALLEKVCEHQPKYTTCAETLAAMLKPYLQSSAVSEPESAASP